MKNLKLYEEFDLSDALDYMRLYDNVAYVAEDDFEMQGMFGRHRIKKGEVITMSVGPIPGKMQITLPGGARTQVSKKELDNAPLKKETQS